MKDQFTSLLQTSMDRRSFLKHMAVAGVMTMGGGAILQSVLGLGSQKTTGASNSTAMYGYGSSAYGGEQR